MDTHHEKLLKKYAPVWVQGVGRSPLHDVITRFDFDGNFDGRDNAASSLKLPLTANVYGEVVAETADSYYLFYGIYHTRDYDKPLRELFFNGAAHDNDFEGAMLNVAKGTGKIRAIETWFHNIFMQCAYSPISRGEQSIDARINVEDGTHPILYVQHGGHGVRCFQKADEAKLLEESHQIYRVAEQADNAAALEGPFIRYTIIAFDIFLKNATGPFNKNSMFTDPFDFGFKNKLIGKYISGKFKNDTSWARPKPPWSWADKRDDLRYGSWYFHPAYVFNKHFGLGLSEKYVGNSSFKTFLAIKQKDLDEWVVGKREENFMGKERNGVFHNALADLNSWFYRLTELLFFYFG
jgi:hypothetical protein